MNEKIVFLDIDGTILNEEKKIPASTKKAIKMLQEQEIIVAIATGRSPSMFTDIVAELKLTSYVSFNGSYVVSDGNVLYKNPLDKTRLLSLEEVSKGKGHPMVFLNEQVLFSNHSDHPSIHEGMGSLKMTHPEFNETFHHENEIYQALLFVEEKDSSWYKMKHNQFDYVRWHDKAIDVLPLGGSKAKGIEEMLIKLNLKAENAYAFGDALNDLEMLKMVGCGVAMGNALPQAKEAADYITEDVGKDGIYKGLLELGLIKE